MGRLRTILAQQYIYLDTNIFIYALEGAEPWASLLSEVFTGLVQGECKAITSQLTLAECLVFPFKQHPELVAVYREALTPGDYLNIMPIDEDILIAAAKLRAETGIKLPDAIHASTALIHSCTCLLTNDVGFKSLSNLNVMLLSDWISAS
ncbi:hypothetical protein AU255_14030 [Methyloprofundus sedimenti]|uniref:PIN domain-containing protein n=1 Tax=Methyloprofundus sedimenti TaxID=1420851 RepID=A0A1V8M3T4_9GAMM|nr:PIN domain-containing protein [Methyloprofundus sedimenti]OQK16214.1 hypothetical protein AU255_14030 [Methyloprofundus sedimenti]